MATALSNVKSKICVEIRAARIKFEAKAVWLSKRVIKRCPATILAISRTERVIGRITFLMVSIKTIKGISTEGVLWGTRCENMWLVNLIQPKSIKVNQRGRANVRVNVIWLEEVKI